MRVASYFFYLKNILKDTNLAITISIKPIVSI